MTTFPASEVRDGMHIAWDLPIGLDDGTVLRCDVFRPEAEGTYPVILSHGPYGKWLHFEQRYPYQYEVLRDRYPDALRGTSGAYLNWETVDPEKWVPHGYAVVRVDSRGSGRSPGVLDPQSMRETNDFVQCIEWAGTRAWSTGKVGLNGISYYAINQWQVAAERPDHLTAICPWEGLSDRYRDGAHHGGIFCNYGQNWFDAQLAPVQHGMGKRGIRSDMTGDWVSGPETLSREALAANRPELDRERCKHKLASDPYWEGRIPDLSRIEVPIFSAGNWGGHGLHLRGNIEGFLRAGSEETWLEIHDGAHWAEFYSDYGVDLQRQFFDYYLKGEANGWVDRPRVQVRVRHPTGGSASRESEEWPLDSTRWQTLHLDAAECELTGGRPTTTSAVTYDPLGTGVTFLTRPFDTESEITGPIAATLFISSRSHDADLFLVVRVFDPHLEEVLFQGAIDPHSPVALGWLRASHRTLDEARSERWRPFHRHDEVRPLKPGEITEMQVEIWPTSVIVPEGYRVGLSIRGSDYVAPGVDPEQTWQGFSGVGSFQHTDPNDRPPAVYGKEVTVHTGEKHPSRVLFPFQPTIGE